ncbi:cytochrome P450 336B1 [Nasonia vitripennis]|uniref:Cytochrome P450 n=1 Tax=Nasonia vitripennis TaxID=7425 RepID=A0A7M6UWD3_NASVI|nr:cytochrome P450 336B1 [Nasonia vitripennis]
MDLSCLLLVAILALSILYWFCTKTFDHWKQQNVPSVPNPRPFFGHFLPVLFIKESLISFVHKIYQQTDASMIGLFLLRKPILLVRDPELVKSIFQTSFNKFHVNGFDLSEKNDPILVKNPFFTADLHLWKTRRARIVNHLSGSKLRQLFVIAEEVCSKMCQFNDRKIKENGDYFECELKEFFVKYTGEIVANAAFAIQGQSYEDNPDRLAFAVIARKLLKPSLMNALKQAMLFYFPEVGSALGIGIMEKSTDNYFRENIKLVLKERKRSNVAPKDFLQSAIEANGIDDIDSIIADAIIFYGDVYETSSTTLAIVIYYLSEYKDIQNKLRTDISSKLQASGGAVNYDFLKSMNYLDQVIQESMRLLTPAGTLMKVCTEEITLKGFDGITCNLKPGTRVFISLTGLHLDSNYWPEPDVFDPERFAPENQANRHKFTFMPFGEGPRMCVGMRLALMIIKLAIVKLLLRYSIEQSSKTKKPLVLDATSFLTYPKGGWWARFKKLSD